MPNLQAAKKALRQNKRRRALNLKRKKKMRETVNKYKKMIEAGKNDEAKKFLPEVYKVLDKMTKVNIIKKNKGDRMKSRLSKKLEVK